MVHSKIVKDKCKTHKYPVIMESTATGCVVLFTAEREGVVVHCGDTITYNLGHKSRDWCMEWFVVYKGQIILSNEEC